MRRFVGLALLLSALLPLRLRGQAAVHGADSASSPSLNQWHPSTSFPGVFYMPLLGDATKPGAYVYRIKVPNGLRIPAHWHTKTMHQTVLSGTFITVMGEPLDTTRARRLPAGSFVVTPAGMRHMEWFEGETIVQVETEGLIETVFVNPGDDPRKRAQP